jgi:serine/threonine-protein kinase
MTAGEKETRRTDIFAAGVVLWETLTGRALFRVPPSLAEGRADRKVVPDPRTIVTTLPSEIAEVTLRALSEEPAERFATALEMADALEAAAERAGLPMSHKAVASFVTTALGKGDARHDLLVRAAEGATVTELQTTTIAVSQHSQPPPAPEHHARERQWPFVLAGMIACSIVIFLVRGSFEGSPAPAAPASTSAAAVTIAPPVEPTATTSPPASPPPATASAPRAPATQLPVPVPRKSKQRTQPTSAPTPATAAPPSTASSSPRAPFENPYL